MFVLTLPTQRSHHKNKKQKKTKKKKNRSSKRSRPTDRVHQNTYISLFFWFFTPHLRVKVSKLFLSRLIFQLWRRAKISPSLGSEQGYKLRQFIETGLRNTHKLTWRRYVVKNKKKTICGIILLRRVIYLGVKQAFGLRIFWCERRVRPSRICRLANFSFLVRS